MHCNLIVRVKNSWLSTALIVTYSDVVISPKKQHTEFSGALWRHENMTLLQDRCLWSTFCTGGLEGLDGGVQPDLANKNTGHKRE